MEEKPGGHRWLRMLGEHPDKPKEASELIAIGYWGDGQNDLPHPSEFVDNEWDPRMRWLATLYLETELPLVSWRGSSWCRICPKEAKPLMGSRCLSDDAFIWPEGLSHYVRHHGLKMPDEFMNHMMLRIRTKRFDVKARAKARAMSKLFPK